MKKRILMALAVILVLIPIISFANNYSSYYTSSTTDLNEYFRLDKYDIADIMEWVRDKKTFITVEVRDGWDGSETAWINCPNLQQYMWNKLQALAPSGYQSNVVDLDESTKNSLFPTDENANTAMYKWGFDIPSNKYFGEWPVISFDASSLYPTSSWWGTFKSVVKGVFGGNVLNDITKDNLSTFFYDGMNDYVDGVYGYQVWIKEHWDEAMDFAIHEKGIGPEYPLLTKNFCGNKKGEFNGKTYNIQTCVIDLGLEEVDCSPEEFERKLRTLWGSEFNEIFFCCVTLTPTADRNGSDSYADTTKYPLRFMPYETDTLSSSDQSGLVQDPRSEMARGDLGFVVKFNISKFFKGDGTVKTTGFFCKMAWLIDSLCSLTYLEKFIPVDSIAGVQIFVTAFITLLSCIFVVRTLIVGKDVLVGNKGWFIGICHVLTTLFLCLFIGALINKNDTVIQIFDNVVNFSDRVGASMFFDEGDSPNTDLVNRPTDKQLHEMIFWLPYYNEWCVYNTSHTYDDTAQDGNNGESELDDWESNMWPNIKGKQLRTWSGALIKSFTDSGSGVISNNAYRVVDHFMAPRLEIHDATTADISTERNENYTYPIQTASTNCVILVILLLIATIIKLFIYICLMYNIIFLYAYIVQSLVISKENRSVQDVVREFVPIGKTFGMYFASGFIQSMIAYYTTKLPVNDIIQVIIYFMIFSIFITIEVYLLFTSMKPKLIEGLRELLNYI